MSSFSTGADSDDVGSRTVPTDRTATAESLTRMLLAMVKAVPSSDNARPKLNCEALSYLIALACLLLLNGCSWVGGTGLTRWVKNGFKVGPNFCPLAVPLEKHWFDVDDPQIVSESADYSQWWTTFNDATLDMLVQTAYRQNLSLRNAALRVMEARAEFGIARGNFFPQRQQLSAAYSGTQISDNDIAFGGGGILPPSVNFPRTFDRWAVGFDAFWELDIWGRYRRLIEAADADLRVTVQDYDDVLVTLIGDVAATYVEYRTLEKQIEYTRDNVVAQEGALQLTRVRFENGATTELDIQEALSNVANTEAAIPSLEAFRRQAVNRLCILLGIPPQDLESCLSQNKGIPKPPDQAIVGIPGELLRRRPDIRAAEFAAAAQSARIGVAESDLYPAFVVSGQIGVQANDLSRLFESGSIAGSVISPGIRWNVLNYGRIQNNIRLQDARFQQLVVNYQNTVLAAQQEVEDAIISFIRSRQRYDLLKKAVEATTRSVQLAELQYRSGTIDFNRVFTLQSALAIQQENLARSKGESTISLVRIYKALGGGWQMQFLPPQPVIIPPNQHAPAGQHEATEPVPDQNGLVLQLLPATEDVPPGEIVLMDPRTVLIDSTHSVRE